MDAFLIRCELCRQSCNQKRYYIVYVFYVVVCTCDDATLRIAAGDSATSIQDAPLHWGAPQKHGGKHAGESVPPDAVLAEIDAQELNRMFVRRRAPRKMR